MDHAVNDFMQSHEAINEELLPNENVLWIGKPELDQRLKSSDIYMIPFSIMWCGFAIFWETSVIKMNAPWFFVVWGIPFVGVGLYMVFGRFIYEQYKKKYLFYCITNKRIIIKQTKLPKKTTSLVLSNIQEVNLRIGKNGNGDIAFGPERSIFNSLHRSYQVPNFQNVRDCKKIYEKIIELKNK